MKTNNIEFQKALEKKRIMPFSQGKKLVKRELNDAHDDLEEADNRFKSEKYKYATITGYYSMFHSARALLYSKGLREKSHYYLIVALNALFVENGLLDDVLLKDFRDAMVLREDADYHGEFSREGAEVVLKSAKDFLNKVETMIEPHKSLKKNT